ncbi:hypothetical protein [Agrobacterium burrii]|uniref:Uncharacterized protein n=1 Tax=Agrobacterium burrii TaxID=2815339 RepID=A0ABS3EJV3_9HYPH|nr:hypothetical protein [Agrobacterium burrii]MBO0132265.1 hypothetical protein [Agrobacterium burrii]
MNDLASIDRSLAMAERHVGEAQRHLAMQREIIERLVGRGGDTRLAWSLLDTFETCLLLHVQDRNRLESLRAETEKGLFERVFVDERAWRMANVR